MPIRLERKGKRSKGSQQFKALKQTAKSFPFYLTKMAVIMVSQTTVPALRLYPTSHRYAPRLCGPFELNTDQALKTLATQPGSPQPAREWASRTQIYC
jgi:hypothetical protein